MTTVWFVRHAEPNYNNHDDRSRELSPKGMKDRKLVTEFLADKSIDAVLSSPYKRAADTVQDFADAYGFAVETIEDFRERAVDSGWIEDFQGFAKRQWEDFDYKLSDGETLREVCGRNIAALKDVLKRYQNQNMVIGTHGTALSTIIHYYQPKFSFPQFEKIQGLMPWVVEFTFEGDHCTGITGYNLFDKTEWYLS